MPSICTSSTSSRPRLSPSGMCGTAGKVMRVERVPLKMGERVPGPPSLSPGLPAIPVLHPGLEHPRPLPCMGASRGATGASQILALCPGLPLTSPGCPWEDGQKMGSQHQDIRSLCQRRARRMSCPLKCTRYRQGRRGPHAPRWRQQLPCQPSACQKRASLSVAWPHVCGVCVSLPGQGRCQHWAGHGPRRI